MNVSLESKRAGIAHRAAGSFSYNCADSLQDLPLAWGIALPRIMHLIAVHKHSGIYAVKGKVCEK